MGNHFVYKYVYKGRIVYIGKVDSGLQRRIDEHAEEDRFRAYPDAEIFCMELNNAAETTCMELLLINKYKPVLNIKDKYPETLSIRFDEPSWVPAKDVLIKASPPAVEGECAISQETYFWEQVMQQAAKGKTDCFYINAGEIHDIDPRGFRLDGSYYQVFTMRYDLAHLAAFVYSANGTENVRKHLGEYVDILRTKEAAANGQAGSGTHPSDQEDLVRHDTRGCEKRGIPRDQAILYEPIQEHLRNGSLYIHSVRD